MIGRWTIAAAPLAGLAVNALTQIVVVHLSRGKVGASIVTGLLCGLTLTLAVISPALTESSSSGGEFVDAWILGTVTYLALSFGFWAFLNLNITSLRIRLLREILRAGGSMDLADVVELYTPAERLHRRLERLEKGGQLIRTNDRWRLSSWQILAIARCVEALRMIVLPHGDRDC